MLRPEGPCPISQWWPPLCASFLRDRFDPQRSVVQGWGKVCIDLKYVLLVSSAHRGIVQVARTYDGTWTIARLRSPDRPARWAALGAAKTYDQLVDFQDVALRAERATA